MGTSVSLQIMSRMGHRPSACHAIRLSIPPPSWPRQQYLVKVSPGLQIPSSTLNIAKRSHAVRKKNALCRSVPISCPHCQSCRVLHACTCTSHVDMAQDQALSMLPFSYTQQEEEEGGRSERTDGDHLSVHLPVDALVRCIPRRWSGGGGRFVIATFIVPGGIGPQTIRVLVHAQALPKRCSLVGTLIQHLVVQYVAMRLVAGHCVQLIAPR